MVYLIGEVRQVNREDLLKSQIKDKYGSVLKFAKATDIPESSIRNIFARGIETVNAGNLVLICKALQIDLDVLMDGEIVARSDNKKDLTLSSEAMALAKDYEVLDEIGKKAVRGLTDTELERATAPQAPVIDLGTIRHYLYRPAAGVDGQVPGEDYEDIPRTPSMPKNADYCLTVSGDSMEPYIHEGQLVFVEKDAPLDMMDVGVFCVNGATYVKQYASYAGQLYLLSANPEREHIIIPSDSAFSVQYEGKVILKKKLPEPKH